MAATPHAGRQALITGAGHGIGRAGALRLARDGAHVGLIDLDAQALEAGAAEIRAQGGTVVTAQADCTDAEALAGAVAAIEGRLGAIDILFNNVGQSAREKATAFMESEEETWRFVLEVSLLAGMRAARLLAPGMCRRGWGRIVNMSSESAFAGDSGLVDYAAAKMGVIGFTRALARELAPQGVTVNAVAPGAIATRAHDRLPAEVIDRIRAQVPMGHVGAPADVAGAVSFLAGDDAAYITGQTLIIDGGRWMV